MQTVRRKEVDDMSIIEKLKEMIQVFRNNDKNADSTEAEALFPHKVLNKSVLVISDTHGHLAYTDPLNILPDIERNKQVDMVFFLGDHDSRDLDKILDILGDVPCFGVAGNHDSFDVYKNHNIENIHGKVIEVDGIRIGGLSGCLKYKNANDRAFLTEEEAEDILSRMDDVDILLTHAPEYREEDADDVAHRGFQAINAYIEKHHPSYHFYGHMHQQTMYADKFGCYHYCVYKAKGFRQI